LKSWGLEGGDEGRPGDVASIEAKLRAVAERGVEWGELTRAFFVAIGVESKASGRFRDELGADVVVGFFPCIEELGCAAPLNRISVLIEICLAAKLIPPNACAAKNFRCSSSMRVDMSSCASRIS
jgi:hypothetical protein